MDINLRALGQEQLKRVSKEFLKMCGEEGFKILNTCGDADI